MVLISVIIPVFNDPEGISQTLESVCNQTYDDYEVIVVDNNSTDHTKSVIEGYITDNSKIRMVEETEIQSSYAARNKGIKASKGEILAFVDSDMIVPHDWLQTINDIIGNKEFIYLGYDVEIITSGGENIAELFEKETAFPMKEYVERKNFTGAGALAVTRDIFLECGLFNDKLVSGGDREFGNRVYNSGCVQQFTDSIVVYHPARISIKSILKKHFRVGRGTVQLRRVNPDKYQYRSLKNFRNYTPPHPETFRKEVKNHSDYNILVLIQLYLILYICKLSTRTGILYEQVRRH